MTNKNPNWLALALFLLCIAPLPGSAAEPAAPINRLLKPQTDANRQLKNDGIHDPASPELAKLKDPTQVLKTLEPGTNGNFVDWSASLNKGKITPAYDARDPAAQATPMDLNVVINVTGSAPNVLFPHAAHLKWLECTNCHASIFQPKKGANKTSMDKILKGESCGVCHGSVAFPVDDCERCHSQKK